jgi:hypothetical protein
MAVGIIFIGESNSEGEALNVHATAAEVASGRAEVRIWCEDTNAFANLNVGTNNNGASAGSPTKHGWELEIANLIEGSDFGSLSASDPAYILKVGVGGSKLEEWDTGDANYTAFAAEYALYAAALPAISDLIIFCSIGINDAVAGTTPAAYYTAFASFIDNIRTTVSDSTAPFIITHLMPKFYSAYNAEIDRLCRDKTAVYRALATQCGTVTGESHLHWNYFGVKKMAQRMVTAYLTAPTAPSAPAAASAITWTDNTNTTTTGDDLTITSGTTGGARRATPLCMTSNWIVEWKADTAIKSDEVVVCLHGTSDNDYDYDSGNNYLCAVFQDGGNLYSSTIGGTATNETAAPAYPFWMRFARAPYGDDVLAQHSTNQTTWTTFKTFSGVLANRYHGIYVKAFMKGTEATAEVTNATVQDPDYVAQPTSLGSGNTPLDVDGCVMRICAQTQVSRYADNDAVYLTEGNALMPDWSNNGSTDMPTLKTAITPTSKAVFRLDGVNDYFSGPDWSSFTEGTIFLVVKTDADPPSAGTQGGLWTTGTHETCWFTWPGDSTIYDHFGTNARKSTGNPTLSLDGAFRVYCVKSISGEWTSRIDGTEHYTTATNTVAFPVGPFIGGGSGQFLDGDFAEVCFFPRGLSSSEITMVEDWLQAEYNDGFPATSTPLFLHHLQQQGMA